jgi:aryl-alcohol dehydrogenase-like predicted oxidoreductase
METRGLGRHGPPLTVVGLGAWAIGGGDWRFGWGPQEDRDSIAAIHRALDTGVNWIDTAAVYGLGHSEETVARALDGRRDRPLVATKCGLVWDDRRRTRIDLSPDSIRREVDASLRRLRVETIDLYQCHWPDPKTPVEATWETMAALKREGKVRLIGVSNFDVPLLGRCLAVAPVDSLQPPYSLLDRAVEQEILPYCREQGIGVVAYSPMQSGLLSGRFDPARLAANDWRRRDAAFTPPLLGRNLAFAERLAAIAARRGKTAGQYAVAWVLRHPAVTSAIVGARRPDQAAANSVAADVTLTDEEAAEIERALAETGARAS